MSKGNVHRTNGTNLTTANELRHRSDITHHKSKPVALHFNLKNHSVNNLKILALTKVNSKRRYDREIMEQRFIAKFNCVELGLNRDLSFMAHYN